MASWLRFETEVPNLASFGRARLRQRITYIATIRSDGSPRVHPVSPFFASAHLLVYMEPTSPKTRDLRHDPRYALHCGTEDNSGGLGEFLVRGRAFEVRDEAVRREAFEAANGDGHHPKDRYILFVLAVDEVFSTVYEEGLPIRTRWKADR